MKKKTIIQYVIYFILGLFIVAMGMKSQGFFEATMPLEKIRILSDCLLFPGALFGGIGALTWIAAKGTFDMLGYGFSYFFSGFVNPKKKRETFYEYKLRKEDDGKWLPELFLVGMFYLLLSIVFVLIYMSMGG